MTATTAVTLVREHRGDFKVHMAGCRDIAKSHDRTQGPGGEPPTFDGATLLDAIVAMDTDAASWFCREPYDGLDDESGESCWSTHHGFEWAPCFADRVKAEGIVFDPATHKPWVSTTRKAEADATATEKVRRVALACGHRSARRIVVGSHEDAYAIANGTVHCRICKAHAGIVGWVAPEGTEAE
jgi:hypothetical protein